MFGKLYKCENALEMKEENWEVETIKGIVHPAMWVNYVVLITLLNIIKVNGDGAVKLKISPWCIHERSNV